MSSGVSAIKLVIGEPRECLQATDFKPLLYPLACMTAVAGPTTDSEQPVAALSVV